MAAKLFEKYSRDSGLSQDDFYDLCKNLFLPDDDINRGKVLEIYRKYNTKENDTMTLEEFKVCWDQWINKVLNPTNALLVIDVQNDFITGSLALRDCEAGEDGAEVVPVINRILENHQFDVIVYSKDWHPRDHISFIDNVLRRERDIACKVRPEGVVVGDEFIFATNPPTKQVLWPAHCLQDSEGAELHRDLKVLPGHVVTHKGTHPEFDSYSSFFDNMRASQTDLHQNLEQRGVTDVFVCGLAFDLCVKYTALDARSLGYGCVVIEDACRSISPKGRERARKEFRGEGCSLKSSNQLSEYLSRVVRHPELAL